MSDQGPAGRFGGKVAVVTAGGAGIGAATAVRFAREGAAVVVGDISGRRATAVAEQIGAAGGRAVGLKMDAADATAVQAAIDLAMQTYGRLDVLFNNAGLADPAPLTAISVESSAVREGASPSQNGIVGGLPFASATRTTPGSTLRMRQDVLPSWKMSPVLDSMAKSSSSVPTSVPSGSSNTW